MNDEELAKEDIGSKLLNLVQGTEFDRKMDEMFERMQAEGLSED